MGNPGIAKVMFWLALVVGGAILGMRYINQHPHAVDINKTNPGVYQPQGGGGGPANPQGGGGNIVVVP